MNEQVARQQADDLVGRHPRIGTADPQVLRRLLAGQFLEEIRVFFLMASAQRALFSNSGSSSLISCVPVGRLGTLRVAAGF